MVPGSASNHARRSSFPLDAVSSIRLRGSGRTTRPSWRAQPNGPSDIAAWATRGAADASRSVRGPGLGGGRLLENEAIVLEELTLEAHAVRAHTGRKGQPKVAAREPARRQSELQHRLSHGPLTEPKTPLAD